MKAERIGPGRWVYVSTDVSGNAPRYAIDVRGLCFHAEVDELSDVLALLDGLTGSAHVYDREARAMLVGGTVDHVYQVISGDSESTQGESEQWW